MPTSWNVTPHRYEHGKPVMTGDKWKVQLLGKAAYLTKRKSPVLEVAAAKMGSTAIAMRSL